MTLAHYEQHAEEFRAGTRDHDVSQNIASLLITAAAPQQLSRFSRIYTEVFYGKRADNVGHCVTLSVRSMAARDSFFLRVSIGSGAIPAPLSPARNPTGPPN